MIHKQVPLKLYKAGEPISRNQDWHLGLWDYSPTTQVWGLLYLDYPTQMCYTWPSSNPKAIVLRNEKHAEKSFQPDWFRWYFDVGAKLYAEFEDLIPACKELGIWEVPVIGGD
jgi:hypothetical protein